MKIYTKTGDQGQTGLFGGPRVAKDHARIEAYGTVDELNAFLGLARCHQLPARIDAVISQVQHDLFAVGAELATPDPAKHGTNMIGAAQITALEEAIDFFEEKLPPLMQFILPAGAAAASSLHVARGVCRRAERRLTTLMANPDEHVSQQILIYLNRLGDLLFVLARAANAEAGIPDVPWVKTKTPEKS